MNKNFIARLLARQHDKETVPSNDVIAGWATSLIHLLYPEMSTNKFESAEELSEAFVKLEKELIDILKTTTACSDCNHKFVAGKFFEHVPELLRLLDSDIEAAVNGDPAAKNEFEVIRAYPGFYTLCFYRIAHKLLKLNVSLLPRILTEYAHCRTGIDIHPAAEIGEYFFIDHGTGTVIGETAKIGNNVKIYQGVTLGALSVDKSMANTKRHPTVEDHVILYSGATILGGDTVVGHHSIIGGNVWLTRSVPPGSMVYHNPEIVVAENKILN
ncbi:MAG TPA: serine O-acetyltransferase EpsC [Flavitalea sp.]|nr:serine O-acetyltransferase EpsC [Flavitalea sp.]